MSPVSASFIIQHITYQIFLLLLALRPCCQPSVSEKKAQSSFYLASAAVHSSVFLSPPLALFLCFSPTERGRCLKNLQFFSFLLRFFCLLFLSNENTAWSCTKAAVLETHKDYTESERHDRITSLPLYSSKTVYIVLHCVTSLDCGVCEIKSQNIDCLNFNIFILFI